MKKIKISLAFFGLLIAAGGMFAFTQHSAEVKKTSPVFANWYVFTGDVDDLEDVQDRTKYVYTSTEPECESTSKICSILVDGPAGVGQHPNSFSNPFLQDLEEAFDGTDIASNIRMKE